MQQRLRSDSATFISQQAEINGNGPVSYFCESVTMKQTTNF